MSFSAAHLIALVAAPAAVLLGGRRLAAGSRLSLLLTLLATWLFATVALCLLIGDGSDISVFIMVFFLVVPWIGALAAAVVATRMVRTRGQFSSAFILSLLGWLAGLAITWFVHVDHAAGLLRYFWESGFLVSLPACYSACGAVVAAGLGDRTT
jgi:hypothetical protein